VIKDFTTKEVVLHVTALACAIVALAIAVYAGRKWATKVYASLGLSRWRAALGAAVIAVVSSAFLFVMLENAKDLFGQSPATEAAAEYSPLGVVLGALLGIVCFFVRPVRHRLTLAMLGWALTTFAATSLGVALGAVFDLLKPVHTGGHIIGPFPWWFDVGLMAGIYGAVAGLGVALWLAAKRRELGLERTSLR
jgi:hypothetical protein